MALELVADVKLDNTCLALIPIMKNPQVFEMFEWPIDVFDKDLQLCPLTDHPACKCFTDGLVAYRHVSNERCFSRLLLTPAHAQSVAQRHESRIRLNVG